MKLIRGNTVSICIQQARKLGLGFPDYCLKSEGRWTFGYLK